MKVLINALLATLIDFPCGCAIPASERIVPATYVRRRVRRRLLSQGKVEAQDFIGI